MKVTHLCPSLYDPKDYIVHGILQARILEWVAFPFSRGSSQPRNRTQVYPPCRQILYQLSHKVPPPNSYNEALTPSVVVFGDGASNELIKTKQDHKGGALIQWD